MSRTIRTRRPFRDAPTFEALESRQLLASAGSIDPTFGNAGALTIPLLAADENNPFAHVGSSNLGAIQADDKIVLAGSITGTTTTEYRIERLNTDGSLDSTFGQGGIATFTGGTGTGSDTSSIPAATALLVQPDGSIDVAGTFSNSTSTTNGSYGILQVTSTGTLDTSFGTQGLATLPTTNAAGEPFVSLKALTLDASGGLIVTGEDMVAVSGSTLPGLYVARFTTNGTLDSSFGTNGIASVKVGVANFAAITTDQASSVVVQPSGRIVVAGSAIAQTPGIGGGPILQTEEGIAVGFTATGTLDTTFGGSSTGEVILPPDPANPSNPGVRTVTAMAVQADGKIVLAGTDAIKLTAFPTGQLTRLNADGTIDTTFGSGGTTPLTGSLTAQGLTVQANGQILVPGFSESPANSGVTTFAVGRYNADGTPDTTFGNHGTPALATYSIAGATASESLTTALINPQGQLILVGSVTTYVTMFSISSPNFEVIRAYATPTPTPAVHLPPADYDGSGQTDLAVYLTSIGAFAYRPTTGGSDVIVPFGIAGAGQTIPAPGDYTGSGQTEIAAYLPSLGIYAYRPANGGPDVLQAFGIAGVGLSIPVPGDYFGTGVDDVAVYLPSVGSFAIRNPAGGPDEIIPFGFAGMGQTIPAPADYFGTGQTDIAAYLPSIGAFAIRNPAGGPDEIIPFGIAGAGNSIPIPGDYDGSGKTELAVYFPKLGYFAYRPADGGPDVILPFGEANDGTVPVPGDYTGVGYDQIGVYDPNYADFAYRPVGGIDVIVPFGAKGIGASLPPAAPASSNVAEAPATTGGKVSVASATSPAGIVSTLSATVPGGPKASAITTSLARVATTRPAQADLSHPSSSSIRSQPHQERSFATRGTARRS